MFKWRWGYKRKKQVDSHLIYYIDMYIEHVYSTVIPCIHTQGRAIYNCTHSQAHNVQVSIIWRSAYTSREMNGNRIIVALLSRRRISILIFFSLLFRRKQEDGQKIYPCVCTCVCVLYYATANILCQNAQSVCVCACVWLRRVYKLEVYT
jgi:hypothetical protein